jgi:hypothetical protein
VAFAADIRCADRLPAANHEVTDRFNGIASPFSRWAMSNIAEEERVYDLSTAKADYPDWAGTPNRSVIVCAHQRSGSTLLGEALYAAGGFGCPLEYFHAGFRPGFAKRWKTDDFRSYLRELYKHRTDATGVISVKMFWRDLAHLIHEEVLKRLASVA